MLTLFLGYPMARNLRAKLPAEDTLFVQDINTAATKKFLDENPQGVRIAGNVRELAEKSVCVRSHFPSFCDEYLFYP
jgi:hypothetical protein